MIQSAVRVIQSTVFARAYKKLHNQQKVKVDDAIQMIVDNPELGTQKRGDLNGVYVYKFKVQSQETLLAHEFDPQTRHLLLLGAHENVYRDLKRKS
ncbi:MAG: type II toxin-antitoxin system RelE/ParE family toxin [Burkholderiaceae bacterium]|nr:type II toxin-antitoxin system RelE/ParE family toxin [Burkholderiaceae bacterium]MCD8536559.1 type II toxin-antitoxin system RelE/ParE family toxin [Burkholderiaceae bacterium]MCD8565320.1 type II toxin-antitoxin system RelE/ParE family toxin [Burkholderiaceae bacterium]